MAPPATCAVQGWSRNGCGGWSLCNVLVIFSFLFFFFFPFMPLKTLIFVPNMLGQVKGGERGDKPHHAHKNQPAINTSMGRRTEHAVGISCPFVVTWHRFLPASALPCLPHSSAESMIRAPLLLTLASGTCQSTWAVQSGFVFFLPSHLAPQGNHVAFAGTCPALRLSSPPLGTSLEGGRDRPIRRPSQELRARAGRREAVDFAECFGFFVFGFFFFFFFFFKPGNIVFSSSCEEKYISMFSNKIQ